MRPALVPLLTLVVACTAGPAPLDSDSDVVDETDPQGVDPVDVPACLADPTCARVLIVAHRGWHRDVPENSLAAIRATAALGAHLAEIDIRDTSDGHLVLMHDDTVDRTTDGSGAVSELTRDALDALTLDDATDDAETQRIPHLEDALALAVELGVGLYLDTKTDRVDLLVEAIHAAGAEAVSVVRKDLGGIGPALEDDLLMIVPADSADAVPDLVTGLPPHAFVEVASGPVVDAELCDAVRDAGLRVQQDVFAGDARWSVSGSYDGWNAFVDAGVQMIQSEAPDGLVTGLGAGDVPESVPAE